ncbi:hypothetical protein EIP86_008231 [Pleurotus ostreatoroseus]|nr:hypothetical protein EIP86_008231 [Pleurotus ostreatoroseus]
MSHGPPSLDSFSERQSMIPSIISQLTDRWCRATRMPLALVLKLDAALPANGMNCDATHPTWVRSLGYAGLTLALSVPSFVLSLLTAMRLLFKSPSPPHSSLQSHSQPLSKSRPVSHALSSQAPLTPLPQRRSRIREAKPRSSLFDSQLITATPEGRGSPYLSPSPLLFPKSGMPDSPGRSPSLAKHSRFHLPFDVPPPPSPTRSVARSRRESALSFVPSQARDSPISVSLSLSGQGQGRDSPLPSPRAPAHQRLDSNQSQSHSPSPIIFANRSRTGSQTTTVVVRVGPSPSPALPYAGTGVSIGAGAGAGENREVIPGIALSPGLNVEEYEDDEDLFSDENDDAELGVAASWIEDGGFDAKPDRRSTAKDSLLYDDGEGEGDGASLYALAPYPRIRRLASGQPPWLDPDDALPASESHLEPGRGLMRTTLFALGLAATLVLASVSSLVDIARAPAPPAPLGTQHVALLLAAWGPCLLVLGVLLQRGCARLRS